MVNREKPMPPIIIDQVEPEIFKHTPPRPLPNFILPNLLGEYLIITPLKTYLDPLLLGGIAAAIALFLLQVGLLLWIVLGLVLAVHVGVALWKLIRHVREDIALVKYGIIVRAHILRVRPQRDIEGSIVAMCLDCAIPISRQRTSVGSVWLTDEVEAARLEKQGRVQIICLPRTPGTWRLLEARSPTVYYTPINATPVIIPTEPDSELHST